MAPRKHQFGELELAILKAVEELHTASVRDVVDLLGPDNAYTTVMTVMTRLAEKGTLQRTKVGRSYEYQLAKQPRGAAHTLLSRLKNRFFGGNPTELVSYLLGTEEISDEDLKTMEKLIRQARRKSS